MSATTKGTRSKWRPSRSEVIAYFVLTVVALIMLPFRSQLTVMESGWVLLSAGPAPPSGILDMTFPFAVVPIAVAVLAYLVIHLPRAVGSREQSAQEADWFARDDEA